LEFGIRKDIKSGGGFVGYKFVISFAAIFFVFYGQLYAYLDPGTGSYIFQLAIAGIAGALLAIKIFWQKIKKFIDDLVKGGKKSGK
jgi:hypothetical protein